MYVCTHIYIFIFISISESMYIFLGAGVSSQNHRAIGLQKKRLLTLKVRKLDKPNEKLPMNPIVRFG